MVRTPHLDRLAAGGGLAFTRAFTTNPICAPSRCSLMSGRYPHTAGHRTQRYLIGRGEPNLMLALKRAGYHTAMLGKNDVLHHSVVADSLDLASSRPLLDRATARARRASPYAVDDPRYYTFLWGAETLAPEQHPDAQANRLAFQFIDARATRAGAAGARGSGGVESEPPFCVWINYDLAHPPYRVEEPWWSMYANGDVGPLAPPPGSGEQAAGPKPVYVDLLHRAHRLHELPRDTLREIRARYLGMISRADDLVGAVVAGLKQRGLWESTALFVVSDHGNYGGDYGLPAKWWTGMEDALLRVPLVARVPGQMRSGVCHELVQHLDLNQTILDLADIEPEQPTSSRSLLPLLRGETDAHRDCVLAASGHWPGQEHPLDLDRSAFVTLDRRDHPYYPWQRVLADHPQASCRTFALRDARWKYVWRSDDVDELYDTEQDPLEERNLVDQPALADQLTRLRTRLMREVFAAVDAPPRIYPDEPGSVLFTES